MADDFHKINKRDIHIAIKNYLANELKLDDKQFRDIFLEYVNDMFKSGTTQEWMVQQILRRINNLRHSEWQEPHAFIADMVRVAAVTIGETITSKIESAIRAEVREIMAKRVDVQISFKSTEKRR